MIMSTCVNRRAFVGAATAFAAVCTTPAADAQPGHLPDDQVFALFKRLVGAWEGSTTARRTFRVDYRLIAGDTVLVETWTMSPTRTSMTVYHMDGAHLVATHYCPQGNQPRLQYREDNTSARFHFVFRDATNLPDANAAHQHSFWIELHGDGGFTRSETYFENGEEGEETTSYRRIAG